MKYYFLFFILIFSQIHAQYFEELSDKVGLNYHFPGIGNQSVGAGVTVIDINNDGWEDLFQAGGIFESKIWINEKGKFKDRTKEYGLDFLAQYFVNAAAAGDFNNDGYEDLFLSNFGMARFGGDKMPPLLLMNEGGKRFVPVFMETFDTAAHFITAAWGDYNLDGFLDLYVVNYLANMNHEYDSISFDHAYDPSCLPNMFFINKGGNGFGDITNRFNMADEGCGLAAVFSDYDRDGDLDLMLLNDFGEWNGLGNLFYRNEYPLDSFTEISREIGFYREMYGMGIGPGDYDRDGDLDYYITNIGQNYLLNNNNGIFEDVAVKLGLSSKMVNDSLYSTSWSGLFFDYDNDAELDLYLNKGNVLAVTPKTAILDPNKLFLNRGGRFEDVSAGSGIDDPLSHRGAALFDFDHDGNLDLVSAVLKLPWSAYGGYNQKIKLYRNLNRSKNNWIGIKLQGSGKTNRSCLGCGLLAKTAEWQMYKEVESGSGHASQSTRIQYFGLGKNKKLSSVKIFWLGEEATEIKNLKANKVYEIGRDGLLKVVY